MYHVENFIFYLKKTVNFQIDELKKISIVNNLFSSDTGSRLNILHTCFDDIESVAQQKSNSEKHPVFSFRWNII